jgi:hypothetical protein
MVDFVSAIGNAEFPHLGSEGAWIYAQKLRRTVSEGLATPYDAVERLIRLVRRIVEESFDFLSPGVGCFVQIDQQKGQSPRLYLTQNREPWCRTFTFITGVKK